MLTATTPGSQAAGEETSDLRAAGLLVGEAGHETDKAQGLTAVLTATTPGCQAAGEETSDLRAAGLLVGEAGHETDKAQGLTAVLTTTARKQQHADTRVQVVRTDLAGQGMALARPVGPQARTGQRIGINASRAADKDGKRVTLSVGQVFSIGIVRSSTTGKRWASSAVLVQDLAPRPRLPQKAGRGHDGDASASLHGTGASAPTRGAQGPAKDRTGRSKREGERHQLTVVDGTRDQELAPRPRLPQKAGRGHDGDASTSLHGTDASAPTRGAQGLPASQPVEDLIGRSEGESKRRQRTAFRVENGPLFCLNCLFV